MDGHDRAGRAQEEEELFGLLERELTEADAIVVADYGHGMLREEVVEQLCAKAPFLAVNTQMNADNRGFNTISKYRRADFVSLSEHELRLEVRSRHRDIRSIVEDVATRIGCRTMVVTRGQRGCAVLDRESGYMEVPAFTSAVVDRVGAGDAVLAIAALFSRLGAPRRDHRACQQRGRGARGRHCRQQVGRRGRPARGRAQSACSHESSSPHRRRRLCRRRPRAAAVGRAATR